MWILTDLTANRAHSWMADIALEDTLEGTDSTRKQR